MSSDPTFLDVEDDEQRQTRIGSFTSSAIAPQKSYTLPGTLLERLNTTSPSSSVSPNPLNIGHERSPGPVEPPAERTTHPTVFVHPR